MVCRGRTSSTMLWDMARLRLWRTPSWLSSRRHALQTGTLQTSPHTIPTTCATVSPWPRREAEECAPIREKTPKFGGTPSAPATDHEAMNAGAMIEAQGRSRPSDRFLCSARRQLKRHGERKFGAPGEFAERARKASRGASRPKRRPGGAKDRDQAVNDITSTTRRTNTTETMLAPWEKEGKRPREMVCVLAKCRVCCG